MAGATLGVALDAAKGEMLVASIAPPPAAAAAAAPIWQAAFADGVRPGAAVGDSFFPCLSGRSGAKVRVNLGLDATRPLRLAPLTREFRPAGQACAADDDTEVRANAPPLARAWARVSGNLDLCLRCLGCMGGDSDMCLVVVVVGDAGERFGRHGWPA